MSNNKPDECMFCSEELEEWSYGYYEENEERAIEGMNICKKCANKIKKFVNSGETEK